MFRPEPLDIVLILIAALLLFGPKRIPETARAIGKSIREFRDGIAGKDEPEPTTREATEKIQSG